jgi:hypothetical protein
MPPILLSDGGCRPRTINYSIYAVFTALTLTLVSNCVSPAKAKIKYAPPGIKFKGSEAWYVKTRYTENLLEVINGRAYTINPGGDMIDLGKARFVTRNVIELLDSKEYYCRKEAFMSTIAKLGNRNIDFTCTSTGIVDTASKPSRQLTTGENLTKRALTPSFPGSGERKPGVWVKKVYQPIIGTMKAGNNYLGHGIVELQIASRDLGTNQEIVRSFSVNCTTRNWKYLDPDAAWFGGIQEMFGKFSFREVGTWACNRYGFKY